jgi:hypothetical protein
MFFSEEKNQKTFIFWRLRLNPGHGLDLGRGGEVKVFWFFSSEKNMLAFCCLARLHDNLGLVRETACRPLDGLQLCGGAAARKSIDFAHAFARGREAGARAAKEIGKRVDGRRQVAGNDGGG